MKRVFSIFLAVYFVWVSVTQPARAFAPIAVLAAPQIVTASGVGYALGAMAGVIGVTGLYMTIKDAQDNAVRIPLGDKPQNLAPAPSAPTTVPGTPVDVVTALGYTGSPQSVCNSIVNVFASDYWVAAGQRTFSIISSTPSCVIKQCDLISNTWSCTNTDTHRVYTYSPAGASVECPSGYTGSGSNCVLSNPRRATDDKICDILISNGQFATADDMNCPSTVDGTKLAPMIRDGKVIAYGTNSSGQPIMWEVTPGPQNYIVREYQQVNTPSQTQIKSTTVMVDTATGAISSVQTSTSPGSISSPSAASSPTVTTTADPSTAANTPTVTQDETKPADLQTCGLPGTSACAIDDSHFDGKDTFSSPRNSEINDKLDQNKTQLESSKDSIPQIATDWLPSLMPGNATTCQPLVYDFTLHNRITGTLLAPNVQLDICDKLELVRAILGYMLGMWTVWYVWRRFTTVNQGA